MMSAHMISSFSFLRLQHSVRSQGDPDFCELQSITRKMPHELTPEIERRFMDLLNSCCTFVPDFADPRIPRTSTFVFSKKQPGFQMSNRIIQEKVRTGYPYVCHNARDEEMLNEGSWNNASRYTSECLNRRVKEPSRLVFFRSASTESHTTPPRKNLVNHSSRTCLTYRLSRNSRITVLLKSSFHLLEEMRPQMIQPRKKICCSQVGHWQKSK